MSEHFNVIVKSIIYKNPMNGFAIINVSDEKTERVFTAKGSLDILNVGERVHLTGKWVVDPKYGSQFRVSDFDLLSSSDVSNITAYLSSGLIKGIGEKLAAAITTKFGTETFDIIEKEPTRLLEISGIGVPRMNMIVKSYMSQVHMRDSILKLREYGLTLSQSVKLFKLYGSDCVAFVEQNPYNLITVIDNIGFATADKIAAKMGIGHDSEFRVRAGIIYMLEWARREGHTFLPYDVLINATSNTLCVNENMVEKMLLALIDDKKLIMVESSVNSVFLPSSFKYEKKCARLLVNIANYHQGKSIRDLSDMIEHYELIYGISLADMQREAIRSVLQNKVTVITGGPGTGKTTILNLAIKILSDNGFKCLLAAPTGRAAKRMSAATEMTAKTLHRMLEYSFVENTFSRDSSFPLEGDVIIVDEMSMVDEFLMASLLDATPKEAKLVLVGDADQLPSVGAGNVLRDIIDSGCFNAIRLTEIFRQSSKSLIITNAHRINSGLELELSDSNGDFVLDSISDSEIAARRIVDIYTSYVNSSKSANPLFEIQALSPMKKGVLGVHNMNSLLRAAVNPPSPDKPEIVVGESVFRLGDKVMQIKNNYEISWVRYSGIVACEEGNGMFNGDIGTIVNVDRSNNSIEVMFDGGAVAVYSSDLFDELEPAYCISIHKSQGSEFPFAVIALQGGSPGFLTRNLLYTAVTRAKEQVYLVGKPSVARSMIENVDTRKRHTALKEMIIEYNEIKQTV